MKATRITIAMSPFPAWLWDVRAEDGRLIRRFKTDAALQAWMRRNGYAA